MNSSEEKKNLPSTHNGHLGPPSPLCGQRHYHHGSSRHHLDRRLLLQVRRERPLVPRLHCLEGRAGCAPPRTRVGRGRGLGRRRGRGEGGVRRRRGAGVQEEEEADARGPQGREPELLRGGEKEKRANRWGTTAAIKKLNQLETTTTEKKTQPHHHHHRPKREKNTIRTNRPPTAYPRSSPPSPPARPRSASAAASARPRGAAARAPCPPSARSPTI